MVVSSKRENSDSFAMFTTSDRNTCRECVRQERCLSGANDQLTPQRSPPAAREPFPRCHIFSKHIDVYYASSFRQSVLSVSFFRSRGAAVARLSLQGCEKTFACQSVNYCNQFPSHRTIHFSNFVLISLPALFVRA